MADMVVFCILRGRGYGFHFKTLRRVSRGSRVLIVVCPLQAADLFVCCCRRCSVLSQLGFRRTLVVEIVGSLMRLS